MTLCPIKLWDAALTLENDGEFYKAYVTQRPAEFSKDRRNRINTALGRLKIYGSDVKDREALRRYLDEAWNLPPARHATDSETNTGPVVEFWKEEVRYPPAKKVEEKPTPKAPDGYFGPLVGSTYRPAQPPKPPDDWPNRGATWTPRDAEALRQMYCGGFAFSDMCRHLGRSPDGILYKLKDLDYLKYRSEDNAYIVQHPHVVPHPPLRPKSYFSNNVPADDTPLDQPQPTKETIMTAITSIIDITTKTFANGIDIATMKDSDIYGMIASQEGEIKKLEAIENKPKRLVNEIEKRKAGIKALVDYLDSKEAK